MLWGSQGVLLKQFSEAFDIGRALRATAQNGGKSHPQKGGDRGGGSGGGGGGTGGSLGLFNGIGQAAAPLGGLLALLGSSVMARLQIGRLALYSCLFASLLVGNVLLFAMPSAKLLLAERRSQLRALAMRQKYNHAGSDSSGSSTNTSSTSSRSGKNGSTSSSSSGGSSRSSVYSTPSDPTAADSVVPVSVLAIPRLLSRSRSLCLLQPCFCSGGYANAFMAGSFTADIIATNLVSQTKICKCIPELD